MHILFGESRMEPVEVPLNDAKAKERKHNRQQVFVQDMEESAKNTSSEAFTLEVSKAGVDAFHVESDKINPMEPIEEQNDEQQKEQMMRQTMRQQVSSGKQHVLLENINISEES